VKGEIELVIAKGFCHPGAVSYQPHMMRYSCFTNLRQQPESGLDFKVSTGLGERWLELCEFAPLEDLGGGYECVTEEWDAHRMLDLFLALVQKKARKGGGHNVILPIYKSHHTLYVPPPILCAVRHRLMDRPPPLESVYCLSSQHH